MLSGSLALFPQGDVRNRPACLWSPTTPSQRAMPRPHALEEGAPSAELAAAVAEHRRRDRCRLCGAKAAVGRAPDNAGEGRLLQHQHHSRLLERGLTNAAVGPGLARSRCSSVPGRRLGAKLTAAHRRQDRSRPGCRSTGSDRALPCKDPGRPSSRHFPFATAPAFARGGYCTDRALRTQRSPRHLHRVVDRPATTTYFGVKSPNHFHAAYARSPPRSLSATAMAPRRRHTQVPVHEPASHLPHVELPEGRVCERSALPRTTPRTTPPSS